jgi:hypothetical protein
LSEKAEDIMQDLALRFFDNRCFVTREKFKKRGFVIHHLWYLENDVRRENYPNGEKGRLEYLTDLRSMVEHMPFRFMLLKNGVHTRIDHPRNGLSRMKKENRDRLFLAVMMTKKEPRIIKKKHYKRYGKK